MSKPNYLFDDRGPAAPGAVSWRRAVTLIVLIFLATRLVILTGAYAGKIAQLRMHFAIDAPFESVKNEAKREAVATPGTPQNDFFERYVRNLGPLMYYDGQWYRDIIVEGYKFEPCKEFGRDEYGRLISSPFNIAFFPLYPLVCGGVAEALGVAKHAEYTHALPPAELLPLNAIMIGVSNVATLMAVLLLYGWLRRRLGHEPGFYACVALLCWPPGCYTTFAYAECLTLLLFVIVCICLDKERFWLAALVCGVATASRPTAITMVPVVLLTYWICSKRRLAPRAALLVPMGLIAVLGIAAYAGYLMYKFDSPFVYSQNFRQGWVTDEQRLTTFRYLIGERVWNQAGYIIKAFRDFPVGLASLASSRTWNMPSILFLLVVCVGGLRRVPRRFRPMLLLGPFVFIQAYLASGGADFGVTPIGRYMSIVVPAFVVLGAWMAKEWRPAARGVFLTLLVLVQYVWAFQFGLGEWPG